MYEGKLEKKKSQSKKIRDIMFRIWETNNENMEFEEYYKSKTDKYIGFLLKKLEPPTPESN